MLAELLSKLRSVTLREMVRETKWIYRYTSRYHKWHILYIFMGLGSTALTVCGSLVFRDMVDAAANHFSGWRIMFLGGAYVALQLLGAGLGAISNRVNTYVTIRAGNEIRSDVLGKFLDVQWESALGYHSGDLLSRVNGDVSTVASGVLGWVPSLIIGVVRLAAALGLIMIFDPIMGLISLLAAPVMVLLSRVLVKNMRSFGQKTRQSQAELTAFYEETLQNLSAVKAFDLKDYHKNKLAALQEQFKSVAMDFNRFSVSSHLVLSMLGMIVSSLCLGWGVFRMWYAGISYGTMVLFVQLAAMVSAAISELVSLVPSAISATVAAGRIMAILDLPMEKTERSANAAHVMTQAQENGITVQLENVHFAYEKGENVLRELSVTAAPGQIIGIISPSGGGKTTLLRLLLGLITPQKGTITFRSGDAAAILEPSMRSLVTYVSQERTVFSGTIAQSLRMLRPDATDAELEDALRAACAWDFVSRLPDGIHTPIAERGNGLSEGQNQRLSIARALLSKAPVLLLDEATSALDFDTERRVLKNILRASQSRTVFVTTHRPAVLKSCTRVFAIREGRAEALSKEEIVNFAQRALIE